MKINKMKKILGYLFYILAAFLIIGIIGQLSTFISAITQVLALFTHEFDGYKFGYAIGQFIGLMLLGFIIVKLLQYAKKWTRKPSDNTTS